MIVVHTAADDKKEIVGFGCHDATCKNFFGPTGGQESHRGQGVGKALLLACLHADAEAGIRLRDHRRSGSRRFLREGRRRER